MDISENPNWMEPQSVRQTCQFSSGARVLTTFKSRIECVSMRAFEVSLNGEKLCLAGIGDDGVLTAIVNWVSGKKAADMFLEVGGLLSLVDEHVSWLNQKPLHVGDEIQVKIIEADSVDSPTRRRRRDPAKDLRNKKEYVRRMARELGWKVETKSVKPQSRKKR
ncbi:MAG TPA: hypothetical protein VHW45_09470 [Candidatus Sulfotelmatobacter sp.]|jgi:hypothetical protein|nr:hypothetical protein [Candidatus Sulfotelmatobacter sp.]